jgi:hypothetical protein
MTGGGLFGTVEVLKGLHALSRVRPLPPKERELYDNARHLLVGEIAAAINIPLHVAEDNLDYALWPPPGMKRKGHVLPPATLGPPAPLRAAGDDDLGFEEDDEAQTPAAVPAVAAGNDDEEEEEAEKVVPAAAPKSAPAKKPAAPAKKPAPAAKKKAPAAKTHAGKKAPAAKKKAPKAKAKRKK